MTPALRELASTIPAALLALTILCLAHIAVGMVEGYADHRFQQDYPNSLIYSRGN